MTTFDMNNAVENALNGGIDKYAVYLRKSRKDIEAEKLGEGETLAKHKKILLELAARKGLYIERIYQEIVSGETIKARPQIQELISDCYAGKYRGILVVDIDRLSRGNQGDAQVILDTLKYSNKNNGLLVVTPTKVFDVAHNPDDEEYMEFVLFMSRREYKTIQKRLERGRVQCVVEGDYMGAYRPYGYDIVVTKTSRTLKPNPAEAPIVQLMYDLAANKQWSAGKIARHLTSMGVPTYSGAGEWNHATIKSILTNPVHKGKVRWNDRMTVKTMVDGKLVASRPRSNHTAHYLEYEGKHPALVDEETFAKANAHFYSDRTKGELKLKNPLAGLLRCKHCGKVMAHRTYKKPGSQYRPRFYHSQSVLCKVKSVIADDVMTALIHALKLYIEDFELKVDNLPDVDENTVNKQIEALQAEMRRTEKILAKLFAAWESEDITNNEFVERKALHNKKIASCKQQIAELEDTIPEQEEYREKIMRLHDAIDALTDPDIDAADKNEFLKAIVEKIEFSRENNEEFILDVFLKT